MLIEKIKQFIFNSDSKKQMGDVKLSSPRDTVSKNLDSKINKMSLKRALPLLSLNKANKLIKFEKLWEFQQEGFTESSACLSPDGKNFFVGRNDDMIYALDTASGKKKWEARVGGAVPSCTSLDGKTLFAVSYNCGIYAINSEAGKILWKFKPQKLVCSSPRISLDGKIVFCGDEDGKFYALDAKSGRKLWKFQAGGRISSSAGLSVDGKTLFVGSEDRNLYALDSASGKEKWKFQAESSIYSSSSISSDGKVVFVGSDDTVYAIDAETGIKKWNFKVAAPFLIHYNGICYADKILFVMIQMGAVGEICAINTENGKKLWKFNVLSDSNPLPNKDGNIVFIAGCDGKVYALDVYSAKKLNDFELDRRNTISSSFLLPDGKIIFSGREKTYALKFNTEEEVIKEEVEEKIDKTSKNNGIIKNGKTVKIRGIEIPINKRYE